MRTKIKRLPCTISRFNIKIKTCKKPRKKMIYKLPVSEISGILLHYCSYAINVDIQEVKRVREELTLSEVADSLKWLFYEEVSGLWK